MLLAQPDETEEDRTDIAGLKATKKSQRSIAAMNLKAKKKTPGKQITEKLFESLFQGERRLFTTDPKETPLLGKCIAFLRMSTKR